jgi:pimeloyl-ACP methyl ester carboxylesterase
MRIRRAWLISSLSFFAVFLTVCVVIIVRGGDPIATAERAAESVVSNIIAPIETPGGYRLLSLDGRDRWVALPADRRLPPRIVLLVHGLDEPGTIFDDLAPAIAGAGMTPVYFEYPNDQRIADSTALLRVALHQLDQRGVDRVDLVCHSMGGLVALDCLTRGSMYAGTTTGNDGLPDVGRWITVGTPFKGAPMAGLRLIAEWREQAVRWTDSIANGAPAPGGTLADGAGEAGVDLAPDSEFLTELSSRPAPIGVSLTAIYSEMAPGVQVAGVGAELGDGVVPVWSAVPAWATDAVKLGVNHRSMLKSASIEQAARNAVGAEPRIAPAIPIILDRLARPADPPPDPGSP